MDKDSTVTLSGFCEHVISKTQSEIYRIIGIIGAGTGALPSEVLRMAEEANVEIVELDKDFSPTDIPQFEDRVYTIQPRPELPHIEWCEPVRFGKGGSKSGRSEKQIRKDRKRSKARKTHRRKK